MKKILYVDYHMFDKNDIIIAFKSLGYEVMENDAPIRRKEDKELIKKELESVIAVEGIYAVFTSNYYVEISEVCQKCHVVYISWTYDSPRIQLYDKSIFNICNYIFTFDSKEYENLVRKGVSRVFYMPLGVNVERLDRIQITDEDRELYGAEVSMVASLYNEAHNFYERMEPKVSEYAKGYLQGVVHAQKNLTSGFILDKVINNPLVLTEMIKAMPYMMSEGSLEDYTYIYSNYVLSRKTAAFQRLEYIREISKRFQMKVYTPGDISTIPSAIDMGVVDHIEDVNKVYRISKINLNITIPSIQAGIPLRAMDIMGAGGFLLTNYQADFDGLFEPGVDYVYYTSIKDAIELIRYYLAHEEERTKIASSGYNKVKNCFSYVILIKEIMDIVCNNN